MKKIMTANFTKIFLLFLAFIFAQSFFRGLSTTYNYYMASFWGNFLTFNAKLSAFLSPVFAFLFVLSIVRDKRTKPISPSLRQLDLSLLLFTSFFSIFMTYNLLRNYESGSLTFILSLLTMFLTGLVFWEVFLRIKERNLHFLWPTFIRRMAEKKALLFALGLPLAGIFLYFLVSVLTWFVIPVMRTNSGLIVRMPNNHTIFNHLLLSSFLALLFAAMTFLMDFILKEDQNYEKTNQEKLRAERFKAELITNMSHDMKTPLTSLINYVDLLKKLPIDQPKFKEYTEVLDRKSLRLKHLIVDLLEASKIGTGNVQLNFEVIDVTEMLGQISGEFEEDFLEKELTLVLRLPDYPCFLNIDSQHFYRVLENLLSNSLKYSLEKTRVFLELREKEGRVEIQLKNTSKAPIDIESSELTEQFIRGERARTQEGHGLGLYISKNLVELMQGQFKVQVTGDLFVAELIF
ncbi:GHKL domain-containing protein [Lactococcus garvieae]|nr:GHKL domain-containing protein [Lactococcus garvieae]